MLFYKSEYYLNYKRLSPNIINNQKDEIEKKEEILFKDDLIEKEARINFLVLGVEKDPRTDSIFFISFNLDKKNLNVISIPRDTYYWDKGYDHPGQRKINAKYARNIRFGKEKAARATIKAVEDILDIPIDYYVLVSYEGVEDIVDTIGGVEVDVPFNMRYKDPTDKPPLKIYISKGNQVLNGEQAVKFLRWRKNNNGIGYPEGDLGRIEAQQNFIKSALKKSIGPKLPFLLTL